MDIKKIEQLVQNRSTHLALKEIKAYAQKNKHHPNCRIQCSDWYRRLGEFKMALYCLEVRADDIVSGGISELWEKLAYARILNTIGASQFACHIIDRMEKSPQLDGNSSLMMGQIYLTNDHFKKALEHFKLAQANLKSHDSHQQKLLSIARADCLAGLGLYDQAIHLAEDVSNQASSNLLKLISLSAQGEYLCLQEDYSNAFKVLEKARPLVKKSDNSNDKGFFYKWYAVALYRQDKKAQANKYFDLAFSHLYNSLNKPEAWLQVFYWRGHVQWAIDKKSFPKEWKIFLNYPTFTGKRQLKLAKSLGLPILATVCDKVLNEPYFAKAGNSHLIDFTSETSTTSGQKISVGLSIPERLIGALVRAGKYGIPKYRLLEYLWSDELYSFPALENRFKQILKEARQMEAKIHHANQMYSIDNSSDQFKTVFSHRPVICGQNFLFKQKRPFTPSQVMNFFNISKSSAMRLMAKWSNLNAIDKLKRSSNYLPSKKVRDHSQTMIN